MSKPPEQVDDLIVVGRVGKPHGLRGEVYVMPSTDEPKRRFAPGALLIPLAPPDLVAPATVRVESHRWHQDRLLVRFVELFDRTSAEAARGWQLQIAVDAGESPEDDNEFYDHQLIGLAVIGPDGAALGVVAGMEHTGAQDLLRVDANGREVLVPFVSALVPSIDVAAGTLTVDDRPGLFTDWESN